METAEAASRRGELLQREPSVLDIPRARRQGAGAAGRHRSAAILETSRQGGEAARARPGRCQGAVAPRADLGPEGLHERGGADLGDAEEVLDVAPGEQGPVELLELADGVGDGEEPPGFRGHRAGPHRQTENGPPGGGVNGFARSMSARMSTRRATRLWPRAAGCASGSTSGLTRVALRPVGCASRHRPPTTRADLAAVPGLGALPRRRPFPCCEHRAANRARRFQVARCTRCGRVDGGKPCPAQPQRCRYKNRVCCQSCSLMVTGIVAASSILRSR